jgi:aryl-alcohol dehydrogenase-like predicted oxidoreductase
LRYTLSNPDLTAAIVGTANLEHLKQNIEFALKGPLPADVIAEANRRLDAIEHEL